MRFLAIVGMICTVCLGLAAQEPAEPAKQEPRVVIFQPSLAEIAQQQQARRAKEKAKNVPLYTNDNLPTSSSGVGIAGSSEIESAGKESAGFATSPETARQIAYLRGKLSRLQQQLEMHQRELSVLQQKLNQNQMQYYPNPYKTLMQEYTRANINKGVDGINEKKQQIAEDQKNIDDLQDQLRRLEWLNPAAASAQSEESAIPPGIKPGTKAYWQARFQAARQQLQTAKEGEKLADNELSLLKLQQLRTLNPNLQSELAAKILSKQQQVEASKQAVEKAQDELDKLQKEFEASGAPADWGN